MKPTHILTTLALAVLGALAPSSLAQAGGLKVAVTPIAGEGGAAIREALSAGLASAGFEVIDAAALDAALGELTVPESGVDSATAVELGKKTGAQVVVAGKVLGAAGIVGKIFSTKNATVVGALAPDVANLPAKVAEAIDANKAMLLE